VRHRVPDDFEPSGSLSVMMPNWASCVNAERGIHQATIDLARQRRPRQTGADALRHLGNRDRLRELPLGAVRQCDNGHSATSARCNLSKKWKSQRPALACRCLAGPAHAGRSPQRNSRAPALPAGTLEADSNTAGGLQAVRRNCPAAGVAARVRKSAQTGSGANRAAMSSLPNLASIPRSAERMRAASSALRSWRARIFSSMLPATISL
jgi:hypothetical protein